MPDSKAAVAEVRLLPMPAGAPGPQALEAPAGRAPRGGCPLGCRERLKSGEDEVVEPRWRESQTSDSSSGQLDRCTDTLGTSPRGHRRAAGSRPAAAGRGAAAGGGWACQPDLDGSSPPGPRLSLGAGHHRGAARGRARLRRRRCWGRRRWRRGLSADGGGGSSFSSLERSCASSKHCCQSHAVLCRYLDASCQCGPWHTCPGAASCLLISKSRSRQASASQRMAEVSVLWMRWAGSGALASRAFTL